MDAQPVDVPTFDAMIKKASSIITDTRVDKHVLLVLGLDEARLDAIGYDRDAEGVTWMEVAARSAVLDPPMSEDESRSMLPDVLGYHTLVSTKMATHLQLTADNMARSTWLAAGILSKDARRAQSAANSFLAHLLRVRSHERSLFETAFVSDEGLYTELCQFADLQDPVCVWRGRGAFAQLFTFLACRFLSQPDSVLDCEGVHAQWKWLEERARGIKFKALNACLKLQNFIHYNGGLPDAAELWPFVCEAKADIAAELRKVNLIEDLPPRMRKNWIYLERFNLRPGDVELVKQAQAHAQGAPKTSADVALGYYLRFLLRPNNFYQLSSLKDDLYFYVAENRSLPGRDAPAEGEAISRPLSVTFFQRVEHALGGTIVEPCDSQSSSLQLQNVTIAEIALACGFQSGAFATDREAEIAIERQFLSHSVLHFESKRMSEDPQRPWVFLLYEESDAEEFFVETAPSRSDLTKFALARWLQKEHGHTDAWRDHAWTALSKQVLLRQVLGGAAVVLPPPAGAAPPGAVGRGGLYSFKLSDVVKPPSSLLGRICRMRHTWSGSWVRPVAMP